MEKIYLLILIAIILLVPHITATSIGDNSTATWYVQGGVDCVGNGNYWNDTRDIFNPVTTNTMGALGNCYNPLGSTTQFCCPSGYQCNYSNMGPLGPVYNCTYTNVLFCNQIMDPGMCANATGMIISNTATANGVTCGPDNNFWSNGSSGFCQNITNCSCAWNGASCVGHYTTYPNCTTSGPGGYSNCDITSTFEDKCNETGIIIDHITAFGDPTLSYCHNDTKQLSCDDLVKLDFFSVGNIIAVIIILIILYWIYYSKKNRKNSLGKKKR